MSMKVLNRASAGTSGRALEENIHAALAAAANPSSTNAYVTRVGLESELGAAGTLAARPSPDPAKIGRFYFATDVVEFYRDNGTAWENLRGYNSYVALVTQTGTNAPTATVLHNSLGGTVVWSRTDTGQYQATLAGAFPADKIAVDPVTNTADGPINGVGSNVTRADDNSITVLTFDTATYNGLDAQLSNSIITIRVYP